MSNYSFGASGSPILRITVIPMWYIQSPGFFFKILKLFFCLHSYLKSIWNSFCRWFKIQVQFYFYPEGWPVMSAPFIN